MTGKKPIVIAVQNRQQFCEHDTEQSAVNEAERLALRHGGEFVVYVPVSISRKTPPVITSPVARVESSDTDYPF